MIRMNTGRAGLVLLSLFAVLVGEDAGANAQTLASGDWTAPHRRRIVLMRHGDVTYFDAQGKQVADPTLVPLTERGRAQADATGAWLRTNMPGKFDLVISSTYPRTVETARRVLAAMGQTGEPTQIEALREMSAGRSREIPTADLPRVSLGMVAPRVPGEQRYLAGETVAELRARVDPAVKTLLDDKTWDTALLVLHGLVNTAILSEALTGDASWYGRIDQGAGCFAIIDVGADLTDAAIKTVNYCPDPSPYAPRTLTLESLLGLALKARR